MDRASQSEIDFDSLQRFLKSVGFCQTAKVNHSLAFLHHQTGTLVTLAIPENGRDVRPADLLSILVRLENQNIVDETILNQFRMGKLPVAS